MIKKESINLLVLLLLTISSFSQFAIAQNIISTEELIGKGNPKLFGKDYKLREEAYIAFKKMQAAALKSNIKIGIASSYRGFAHQKRIWERKFNRNKFKGLSGKENIKKIIEYSTIPGTSRHHWGTDIDIYQTNVKQPNGILQTKNYHENGVFYKLKKWMDANSEQFGFYLVYTNSPNRKGFKYEPWHYTYKPLSLQYLKKYQEINISELLKKDKLTGSSNFSEEFINQYTKENILDINPELL